MSLPRARPDAQARHDMNATAARTRVLLLHGLGMPLARLIASAAPPGIDLVLVHGDTPEAEQVELARDVDFIIMYRAQLRPAVLRSAARLRLVQLLAAGYDGMDFSVMEEQGIPCARNGGANSRAVADQCLAMMLALYRRLFLTDQDVRAGRWNSGTTGLNTFEMAGKTVGLVGVGHIGRHVARRVQGFEAQVQYFSRNRLSASLERELKLRYAPLDDLFRTSDIVSLHAPLTPQTRHLVDATRLASMKPTAILINSARGELVDESALTSALSEGRLAGAGLDVFEKEPVETSNALLSLHNVILSPHSAGTTADTWVRRGHFAFENLARVLANEPPIELVGNVRQPRVIG
jgi:phosphoglycerate dehydrogenase-like enzyme